MVKVNDIQIYRQFNESCLCRSCSLQRKATAVDWVILDLYAACGMPGLIEAKIQEILAR
jgi:hypothetical protein